ALVHTGYHRAHGQQGDHRNADHLYADAHRDTGPQVVQPGIDLRHRQTEGRGDTEHGAEDGEGIHRMADRSVDAVADQGIQRRADRQRQAMAEGEVRQHQPGQAVDGPDVKAPVEERDLHGLLGRIQGQPRGALGWVGIMQYRLRHAEEQQGDTVARGEQHGKPGGEAVLRLGMVRAQLDLAPSAHGDDDDEHQEDGHRQHVEPAEGLGDVAQYRREQLTGQLGLTGGTDDQQQDEKECRYEDRQQDGGIPETASGGFRHAGHTPWSEALRAGSAALSQEYSSRF